MGRTRQGRIAMERGYQALGKKAPAKGKGAAGEDLFAGAEEE